MDFRAKFAAPDSLMVEFCYNGLAPKDMAAHLAVLAHEFLYGDWQKVQSLGTVPEVLGSFPDSGKAGLRWSWSGLAYPQEQLKVLGHCLLSKAYALWTTPPTPPSPTQLFQPPPPGFIMPGFGRG